MPFLGTTGGGSVKQYGGQANLGYFIKNSLRFRASNSATLSRTPSVSGNRKVWTWSAWVKRGALDSGATDRILFASPSQSGNDGIAAIYFDNDQLHTYYDTSGANPYGPIGPALYRDPAAWMHIVWAVDAANTIHYVYVNNTLVSTDAAYYPPNYDYSMNRSGYTHYFGTQAWGPTNYFDGYMAEVNFVDGQALTPSSFGKTDAATNQWIPKKFAGTYGTNGFYLKFADASAATAAAIGKDSSPNGNNWTPSGISVTADVTYDAMIDSPTLSAVASNYATWNPLNAVQSTLSQGNLLSSATGSSTNVLSTFPTATTGKWYMEIVLNFTVNINWPIVMGATDGGNTYLNLYTDWSARAINKSVNGTTSSVTPSGNFPANGDILKIAYDADNGKLWLGLNSNWYGTSGSLTGDPATGTDATLSGATGKQIYPWHSSAGGPAQNAYLNCGQRPFAYTPPSGFKSLNTFNLP